MKLVERHIISREHPWYKSADELCFASKNLYNYANYIVRKSFIVDNKYLENNKIYHLVKGHESYKALPAKVSNQVLMLLQKNWKSFFAAMKKWGEHPEKFLGRPRLPKYKHKQQGRNVVIYELGAISKPNLQKGLVKLSKTSIEVKTKAENVLQVRIVPQCHQYVIEVVYEHSAIQPQTNSQAIASVDLGINNLATLTSNKKGFQPVLVNGRPLKSINQFYNKLRAELQIFLNSEKKKTSSRIKKLTAKRNNKVDNFLHNASRYIINHLVANQIGTLVIGKNQLWKQEVEMGKQNNQQFVCIPHTKLIEQLTYKAKLVGIKIIIQEESYTSKASFLDGDFIPTYGSNDAKEVKFSGKRIKRGLYRSAKKMLLNADVNGSYNILRKAVPTGFPNGIEGVAVLPIRVTPGKARKSSYGHK